MLIWYKKKTVNVAFAMRFYCENEKRMFFRTMKIADFFSCKNECENEKFEYKKSVIIEKNFQWLIFKYIYIFII